MSNAESRTNRLAAAIAALVGVLALLISAYTAYVQRQQVRAQVWPILLYSTGNEPTLAVWLTNKGMGPALIRHVVVTVDGEPQPRWPNVMLRLLGPGTYKQLVNSISDSVLAPGEQVALFEPRDPKTGKPLELEPAGGVGARFNVESSRIGIEVCYCSTLGECWLLRAGANQPPQTTETTRCPRASARTFLE